MNIGNIFFCKRDEFNLGFENGEKNYRNIEEEELDKFLDEKFGEWESNNEIQNI